MRSRATSGEPACALAPDERESLLLMRNLRPVARQWCFAASARTSSGPEGRRTPERMAMKGARQAGQPHLHGIAASSHLPGTGPGEPVLRSGRSESLRASPKGVTTATRTEREREVGKPIPSPPPRNHTTVPSGFESLVLESKLRPSEQKSEPAGRCRASPLVNCEPLSKDAGRTPGMAVPPGKPEGSGVSREGRAATTSGSAQPASWCRSHSLGARAEPPRRKSGCPVGSNAAPEGVGRDPRAARSSSDWMELVIRRNQHSPEGSAAIAGKPDIALDPGLAARSLERAVQPDQSSSRSSPGKPGIGREPIDAACGLMVLRFPPVNRSKGGGTGDGATDSASRSRLAPWRRIATLRRGGRGSAS
jgi:hypothetical protein